MSEVTQLITDIKGAISTILEGDVSEVNGFAERQVEAIAVQSELVAKGILTGQITEATKDFFLEGIKDMITNFVKTLQGLIVATVEKVWNAVVGVVWSTIGRIAGIELGVA